MPTAKSKRHLKKNSPNVIISVIVAAALVVLGYFVFSLQAAGPKAVINVGTNKAVNLPAAIVSDKSASGGKSLRFQKGFLPIYNMPATIVGKPVCDATMPDQSQAIYNWVNSIPDNSMALLRKDTCFRMESELPVTNKTNFILDGNGAKLQAFTDGCDSQDPNPTANNNPFDYCKYIQMYPACHLAAPDNNPCASPSWPQSRRRLEVTKNSNLTIKNIKLDGGHPNPGANGTYDPRFAFQHGINFREENNGVIIDNVQIDRVYGDYIYIGGANEFNLTIQNSRFGEMAGSDKHGTGRQGVGIVSGQNITIKNNRISEVRRTVIDIEPLSSNVVIRNVYFDNNTIGNHGLNFFSNNPYGKALTIIENVYFRNNIHNANRFGIESNAATDPALLAKINQNDPKTFTRRNYQFINNTSTGADASGTCEPGNNGSYWHFSGIDGLVIKGNTAKTGAGRCMHFMRILKVRNVSAIDNNLLNGTAMTQPYKTVPYLDSAIICEKNNKFGNPLTMATILSPATLCR